MFILLPFGSIQRCLQDWLIAMQAPGLLCLDDDDALAADGNALCGSHDASTGQAALQMVTVYGLYRPCMSRGQGGVLVQGVVRPEAASNEIAAWPQVLKQVKLRGHGVVTDAAYAQKRNARAITARGGE